MAEGVFVMFFLLKLLYECYILSLMNTSKNIKLAIIFLAGALVGLMGYSRFYAVSSPETSIDTGNTTTTDTTELDAILGDLASSTSGDISKKPAITTDTIKKPISGIQKPSTNEQALSLPNLDRIVINANISDDKKQEYTGRMKDIANAIRRGEPLYEQLIELASYRKLVEDYAGAEEIWLDMTKRYPTSRQAYENLGNLYHFYKKDYPAAEKAMKKAIENEVTYPYGYVNLFELYTLSYTEKKELAEQVLLDGLKQTGNNVLIDITIAQYYVDEHKIEDAKKHFESVLRFAQDVKDIHLETMAKEGLEKLNTPTGN